MVFFIFHFLKYCDTLKYCFPTWQHSLHVMWYLAKTGIILTQHFKESRLDALYIYYSRFLFGGIVGINVKLITVCFWINASFAICYNDFACRYWGGCSLWRHYWDSGGSVCSSRVYFYCLENQVGSSIPISSHLYLILCFKIDVKGKPSFFFLIFIIW